MIVSLARSKIREMLIHGKQRGRVMDLEYSSERGSGVGQRNPPFVAVLMATLNQWSSTLSVPSIPSHTLAVLPFLFAHSTHPTLSILMFNYSSFPMMLTMFLKVHF